MTEYLNELDVVENELDETTEGEETVAEVEDDESTTEVSIEELVLDIVSALPSEVTPYQIHSVVNTVFDALGAGKSVRPQMMYNYAKNGLIVKGAKDRKRFSQDEVIAFAVKYVTKHTSK